MHRPILRAYTLFAAKIGAGIFVLVESYRMVASGEPWWLISGVNLIFHEAGHVLFIFMGSFMHALGGTILECTIPAAIAVYFFRKGERASAGVCLWWLSTALYGVGVYARDARALALPLLGGDSVGHDWASILGTLGLTPYDQSIGDFFFALSVCAAVVSLLLIALSARNDLATITRSQST